MNIVLLEPFFAGSHASWAKQLKANSAHSIEILALKGLYWKWRMHGGAVSLAKQYIQGDFKPDLFIASDMLDLTIFQALTRSQTANIPFLVYFHENQLTYPWSKSDPDPALERDRHYGFINYSSCLSADRVLFNSRYHLDSFLEELPRFLKFFPDYNELASAELIRSKSEVLYLGIDLKRFNQFKEKGDKLKQDLSPDLPIILWNHRWEYDKNPTDFYELLLRLEQDLISFKLVLLGESYCQVPDVFDLIKSKFSENILHCGFVEDFSEYASWLWASDILPVTSNQDFFGVSIVEAIYCKTTPLLPNRLSYPEILPIAKFSDCYYLELNELYQKCIKSIQTKSEYSDAVIKYDWSYLVGEYDQRFLDVVDL
ncbi:MAG: DUF3524 domain-containing protein [Deltaproteobacteria bacterium]|nr:DUF3524 domain-containing protein [Deltaproteobacteria bacterium]